MQIKLRKVVEITCLELTKEVDKILRSKNLIEEDDCLVPIDVCSTLTFEVKQAANLRGLEKGLVDQIQHQVKSSSDF